MRFTLKHIQDLQKAGTIAGYRVNEGKVSPDQKQGKESLKKGKSKKGQKTKDWIAKNLWYWCRANKYHLLTEQVFDENRKWRFDWFICGLKIGIEYEGLMSEKSGHTTVTGYTGDTEKYNAAAKQGITVLRYTVLNYKNLFRDLEPPTTRN